MSQREYPSSNKPESHWSKQLHKLAEGDLAALDALYRQFAPTVYQIALNILQDAAEAEDVCHDVFLELLQQPGQFDPQRGSIQAWLAVKTKSRSIDRLRKKQRQIKASQWREPALHRDPTPEIAFGILEREKLREALKRLPPGQREAITATYFHAMTQQEWARISGHPLGTVKSWIRYGMKNIKKHLVQLGWLDPSEGGRAHEPKQM